MAAAPNLTTQQLIQGLSIEVTNYWRRNYPEAWARLADDFKPLIYRVPTKNDNLHITIEAEQRRLKFMDIGTSLSTMKTIGKQFPIRLRKVESPGVEVPTTQIQDSLIGPWVQRDIAGMMTMLSRAPKERLIQSLIDGDTDPFWTTWDGEQMFSTTHSVGAAGVTWGNLEPGDSLSSADLTVENIFLLMSKLQTVPSGPEGLPFPLNDPTYYIIVPPGPLYQAALEVTANVWSPDGGRFTENVAVTQLKGLFKVIADARLAGDPDTWYFVATTPETVPWINLYMTGGGSGELIPLIDPWMTNVKDENRYLWQAFSIEETFPVRFDMMVKIVGGG